jgi:histidinol-phosphate/aromatic aminotransferase/cobyric acid decarboxylase-like protein
MIPNLDPYVVYAIQEITRWMGANSVTIVIVTNGLTALKIWAIRSGRSKDDKILTLLLSFISFKWLATLTRKSTPDTNDRTGG